MTTRTAPAAENRPHAIRQSLQLSRRAVFSMLRQPQVLVPSLFFPLFFCALNAAAFDRITSAQPAFAAQFDSFLDFLLPATVLQGVLFGSTQAGTEMANDIEIGFFDRLLASPVSRTSILVGRLAGGALLGAAQAVFFTVILTLFGANVKGGIAAIAVLVVVSSLLAMGIGGFGVTLGIRTGSAEAVQGSFPLIFVLMFTSSAFFPRDLMSGWYRSVATYNPISWILDALRDLQTLGWSTERAAVAIGTATALAALSIVIAQRALRHRLRTTT
ncbi:ABC transporter permease [Actinospongicola halichondriae]|uniref:ABC transporter permease n=1 Tax=Actinospongicola halichondriae TaxID=3236844 RepID=UPI003D528166